MKSELSTGEIPEKSDVELVARWTSRVTHSAVEFTVIIKLLGNQWQSSLAAVEASSPQVRVVVCAN
jgi:hypothetical protein